MAKTSCLSCGIRVFWFLSRGTFDLNTLDPDPLFLRQTEFVCLRNRYGSDLTPEQKDALLDVIRARPHPSISAEIRREILNSVVRGEPRPEEGAADVDMV